MHIGMNFGQALEALKDGKRVARDGWNGKGMWLVLMTPGEPVGDEGVCFAVGWSFSRDVRVASRVRFEGEKCELRVLPWISMKTADNCFVPWLASQTDLLAEDWAVVVVS